MGHGNQAMKYYKSICPSNKEDQIEIYRTEPYVYCQMTAGPDAPTPGEGKNSWLTGTAAWSFVALSQFILGIRPDYDGLIVDPCIPNDWEKYSVVRKFRNSTYHITINNPGKINKGVKKLMLNGNPVRGNKIPVTNDRKDHYVEVEIG
jgi:cellobiose phosphorylase